MSKQQSKFPGLNNENEEQDGDQTLREDLESGAGIHNLVYNKEENSFEYDVVSADKEYDHPDPYKTAVKNGGDINSDYDEANPTAVDEYDQKDELIDEELEDLGMHIDNGGIVEVSPVDEELSKTPEDDRDDLDEEGYPKNDMDKDSGDLMR
ncbi:hypothetical protein GZH53_15650 [Flavihumibacter sp. R14]|nr:hypothetical protein [Flavihumibacter soli]